MPLLNRKVFIQYKGRCDCEIGTIDSLQCVIICIFLIWNTLWNALRRSCVLVMKFLMRIPFNSTCKWVSVVGQWKISWYSSTLLLILELLIKEKKLLFKGWTFIRIGFRLLSFITALSRILDHSWYAYLSLFERRHSVGIKEVGQMQETFSAQWCYHWMMLVEITET